MQKTFSQMHWLENILSFWSDNMLSFGFLLILITTMIVINLNPNILERVIYVGFGSLGFGFYYTFGALFKLYILGLAMFTIEEQFYKLVIVYNPKFRYGYLKQELEAK